MSHLLLNIFLALTWAAVMGTFDLQTLIIGYIFGYLIVLLSRPILGPSDYAFKIWQALGLMGFFLKELFLSSLVVARDVLRPQFHMHSGVIGIPLDAKTDIEITMLANMISLTPGTLSLDVSEDKKTLFIHAMYLDKDDVQAAVRQIKGGMEARLLKVLR